MTIVGSFLEKRRLKIDGLWYISVTRFFSVNVSLILESDKFHLNETGLKNLLRLGSSSTTIFGVLRVEYKARLMYIAKNFPPLGCTTPCEIQNQYQP